MSDDVESAGGLGLSYVLALGVLEDKECYKRLRASSFSRKMVRSYRLSFIYSV
jgi:hypothetical protein